MMVPILRLTLPVALVAATFALTACEPTTGQPNVRTGVSVHVGYGRGPWWRWGGYYPRPPGVLPPDVLPPEPGLPIEPSPPIAVPLPEPDFGGGDFGGFDGGFDAGGFDL